MDIINKKKTFLIALLIISFSNYGQIDILNTIPKEKIILNTNTNLFVSGESLYYNLYCFEQKSNALSSISKIAYVLLINDSKKIVFKHKVLLKDGLGFGDFHLPSRLYTGNYKLIAYTNWMKNNTETPFIFTDIHIINPFSKRVKSGKKDVDSLVIKKNTHQKNRLFQKTYKTRSEVKLNLANYKGLSNGNYSISVRKIETIEVIQTKKQVITNYQNRNTLFLPEIKGELISGTVYSKNTKNPEKNKILTLSIEGNPAIFKNVKTNDRGKFTFNLYETYSTNILIIQVIDKNPNNFTIELDKFSFDDKELLEFNNVYFDKNISTWLVNKSIQNQIESAYFSSKKDNLKQKKIPLSFFGKASVTYILDDYTRFATTKETITEIVVDVSVKTKNKKKFININTPETILDKQIGEQNNLLLVDGVPIQDAEILLNINPQSIHQIEVVFDKYIYGPSIFDGILSVSTKKQDFSLPNSFSHLKKQFASPLNEKEYYNPNYAASNNEHKRIPDYRTQLLWKPDVTIGDNNDNIVKFHTSDIQGLFEITIKGYTKNNKPIHINTYIKVQ